MSDSEYIAHIIKSARRLPERFQKIGASEVRWWEGKPGDAVIMASGGTLGDRIFAEHIVKHQLEPFGYKRATFYFALDEQTETQDQPQEQQEESAIDRRPEDTSLETNQNWNKVLEKAKRLVNSGNVQILRNGMNNIVAHVQGDHGAYTVEIGRDDPKSRAITSWKCECKWDQYAWQRTRQWKKYEGRPCSHVMAAYYQAKMLPLDEHTDPAGAAGQSDQAPSRVPTGIPPQQAPMGGEPSPFAKAPGTETGTVPTEIKPPRGLYQMRPPEAPENELVQKQFVEPRLGPYAPDRGYVFSPELEDSDYRNELYDTGIIPESPVERQQREMEMMEQRRQQISDPNKTRRPTPPSLGVETPGTFSSVMAATPGWYKYNNGDIIMLKEDAIGLTEGPSNAEGLDEYREVAAGTTGEVYAQDKTTGFIEAIFPLEGGPRTPTHVRCFLEPKEVEPGSNKFNIDNPMIGTTDWGEILPDDQS